MLRLYLEGAGYAIFEAENGEQGLVVLQNKPVDLIILDIFMPEKDGFETLGELCPTKDAHKVLAISGGGERRNMDCLRYSKMLGATATMEKPFDKKTLLETVKKLIGEGQTTS